jgi:hypothetical protein
LGPRHNAVAETHTLEHPMNASLSLNPTKSMRVLIPTLCTVLGVVAGLLGDLVGGGVESLGTDILGALVLSPLLVTVGGFSVTVPELRWAFFIGGLVFCDGVDIAGLLPTPPPNGRRDVGITPRS